MKVYNSDIKILNNPSNLHNTKMLNNKLSQLGASQVTSNLNNKFDNVANSYRYEAKNGHIDKNQFPPPNETRVASLPPNPKRFATKDQRETFNVLDSKRDWNAASMSRGRYNQNDNQVISKRSISVQNSRFENDLFSNNNVTNDSPHKLNNGDLIDRYGKVKQNYV